MVLRTSSLGSLFVSSLLPLPPLPPLAPLRLFLSEPLPIDSSKKASVALRFTPSGFVARFDRLGLSWLAALASALWNRCKALMYICCGVSLIVPDCTPLRICANRLCTCVWKAASSGLRARRLRLLITPLPAMAITSPTSPWRSAMRRRRSAPPSIRFLLL